MKAMRRAMHRSAVKCLSYLLNLIDWLMIALYDCFRTLTAGRPFTAPLPATTCRWWSSWSSMGPASWPQHSQTTRRQRKSVKKTKRVSTDARNICTRFRYISTLKFKDLSIRVNISSWSHADIDLSIYRQIQTDLLEISWGISVSASWTPCVKILKCF